MIVPREKINSLRRFSLKRGETHFKRISKRRRIGTEREGKKARGEKERNRETNRRREEKKREAKRRRVGRLRFMGERINSYSESEGTGAREGDDFIDRF